MFFYDMVQMQTLKITRSLMLAFQKSGLIYHLVNNTQKSGINTPSNPSPLPLPNLEEAGFIRR